MSLPSEKNINIFKSYSGFTFVFVLKTQSIEEARVHSMLQKNDDVEIEQNDEHSDAFGVGYILLLDDIKTCTKK